jgi:hypothetical protein
MLGEVCSVYYDYIRLVHAVCGWVNLGQVRFCCVRLGEISYGLDSLLQVI